MSLKESVKHQYVGVFESEAIKRVVRLAEKVAPYNIPVLLTGETGVGKEVFADLIHSLSRRKNIPPVKVNCTTIPQTLAESLFFGSVKGSYTGSTGNTIGYFEEANQSTIFLDELPEMPFDIQTKLLRVLQEKRFRPVGGRTDVTSDFRIIWSSNTQIQNAIKERKLREDLYYRISDATIEIPPLRERTADIRPLAGFFLRQVVTEYQKEVRGFSKEAMDSFEHYAWPGNVRHLRAVVRNAVVMCESAIIEQCDINVDVEKYPHLSVLETAEREQIERMLRLTGGDKFHAAKRLGIGRQTIYNKIRRYAIGEASPSRRNNGNGQSSTSALVPFRKKLTAEEILSREGKLEFNQIKSQREYVRLNQMVLDAIEASRNNSERAARILKTSVERLKQVVLVFEIDLNITSTFSAEVRSVPSNLSQIRGGGEILEAEIVQ